MLPPVKPRSGATGATHAHRPMSPERAKAVRGVPCVSCDATRSPDSRLGFASHPPRRHAVPSFAATTSNVDFLTPTYHVCAQLLRHAPIRACITRPHHYPRLVTTSLQNLPPLTPDQTNVVIAMLGVDGRLIDAANFTDLPLGAFLDALESPEVRAHLDAAERAARRRARTRLADEAHEAIDVLSEIIRDRDHDKTEQIGRASCRERV